RSAIGSLASLPHNHARLPPPLLLLSPAASPSTQPHPSIHRSRCIPPISPPTAGMNSSSSPTLFHLPSSTAHTLSPGLPAGSSTTPRPLPDDAPPAAAFFPLLPSHTPLPSSASLRSISNSLVGPLHPPASLSRASRFLLLSSPPERILLPHLLARTPVSILQTSPHTSASTRRAASPVPVPLPPTFRSLLPPSPPAAPPGCNAPASPIPSRRTLSGSASTVLLLSAPLALPRPVRTPSPTPPALRLSGARRTAAASTAALPASLSLSPGCSESSLLPTRRSYPLLPLAPLPTPLSRSHTVLLPLSFWLRHIPLLSL